MLKLWMYFSNLLYLLHLRLFSYRVAWEMYWSAVHTKKEALKHGEDAVVRVAIDDDLLVYIPKGKRRPVKITQAMKDKYKHDKQIDRIIASAYESVGKEE